MNDTEYERNIHLNIQSTPSDPNITNLQSIPRPKLLFKQDVHIHFYKQSNIV